MSRKKKIETEIAQEENPMETPIINEAEAGMAMPEEPKAEETPAPKKRGRRKKSEIPETQDVVTEAPESTQEKEVTPPHNISDLPPEEPAQVLGYQSIFENAFGSVMQQARDEFKKAEEKAKAEIKEYKDKIKELNEKIQNLEKENAESKEKIQNITEELENTRTAAENEIKNAQKIRTESETRIEVCNQKDEIIRLYTDFAEKMNRFVPTDILLNLLLKNMENGFITVSNPQNDSEKPEQYIYSKKEESWIKGTETNNQAEMLEQITNIVLRQARNGYITLSVPQKSNGKEQLVRLCHSPRENAWVIDKKPAEGITKITDMINELNYECFKSKVPITIYCQYKKNGKEEIIKSVISPAAVDYEGDDKHTFYDLLCVLSGNFITKPKQNKEADLDPFQVAMDEEMSE